MRVIKSIVKHFWLGLNVIASNKIVVLLIICLGIYSLNTTKCYKEELEHYQNDELTEKISNNVVSYYDDVNLDTEKLKGIAASELVTCINQRIEIDSLNESVKGKIDELNNLYNEEDNYFSFLYQDIYTGFSISYNEEGAIFTASTIKAPAMIYLYELASEGKIDLNTELTYTKEFYSGGSGVLKNKEFNTKYKVEELIQYAIHDSDNIAYKMLMNYYGRESMYSYWSSLGTKNIFKYDTVWGYTSSKDASIYMKELYDFYLDDNEYGERLMGYFKNAEWKQITDKNGEYNTANKGGWSDETFHDVAIVFEENPYILVIMSKTGESDYNYLFKTTSKLVGEIHDEYWKFKMEECNKISQY